MRPGFEGYRFGKLDKSLFGLLSWRGVLVLAVTIALLIATFVAAAGLFLILLPVAVVAAVIGRLLYGRRRAAQPQPQPRGPAPVIEGRFEIVGVDENRRPGQGWGPQQPGTDSSRR